MERKERCFEVRTAEGALLFSFCLIEKELEGKKPESAEGEKGKQKETVNKGNGKGNGDEANMSDAQKRFLFRLLADNKGVEGDEAKKYLTELFQVGSLKEVSKMEASKAIEQLLGENGGNKNGSSI